MAQTALKSSTPSQALVSEPVQPTPITERVAAALADGYGVGSDGLLKLRAEADTAFLEVQELESAARARSLDVALSAIHAREARDDADDHLHEMRRLQASIAKIDEVLAAVRAVEHRSSIMPAYLAHKAKRAALVERIRKEWPDLSSRMVDLIETIEAFRQTPGVEVPDGEDPLREDVEAEARGCDSSFYVAPYHGSGVAEAPRLRSARIPRFEPSSAQGSRYAWPRSG